MSKIRLGISSDYERILELEYTCFGEAEMVDKNGLKERMDQYPEHTLVLIEDNKIVAYASYILSDHFYLDDAFFGPHPLDSSEGQYCIIIGVATDPAYRKHGYSSQLIEALKESIDKPMLLTCHDYLIPFYQKLGFKLVNTSSSTFNGCTWYNMTYHTDIIPNK